MAESANLPREQRQGWALCLSGGGFRAALFHLGALRRLNAVAFLSRVRSSSSVSAGPVGDGLLARLWRDRPTTEAPKFKAFPQYEQMLREFCSHDIRTGPVLWERLDPRNWP